MLRLAAGCGMVLVSSGFPLAPGVLTAQRLSQIRLFVGAEEQALHVEPLHGTHPDGSLRAALVQFNYSLSFGTPLRGHVVIGEARGTAQMPQPKARRAPQAVVLPTDPAYLISTQLVGPTISAASASRLSSAFQGYESDFGKHADHHWHRSGAAWTENYYDRALIYYAWWVRTGEVEYWKRATALAVSYRRDYLEANSYGSSPHWAQLEGLEKHYLLTGDQASRYAVARVAETFRSLYHRSGDPTSLGSTASWWDNRIQARVLHSYLLAWRLQATGTSSLNYPALMDEALTLILGTQTADGSYRFAQLCGGSLNYMTGLLNDVLIKYHTYYKPDPRIAPAVRRAVDFLWNTQWLTSAQAFQYLSLTCTGIGAPTPAPDLNNLMVTGFGWMYQQTGDATYRTRGDQIFAGGVYGAYLTGSKQFNEQYTSSFRYSTMR